MEIVIKGEAKGIAALVFAVQERQENSHCNNCEEFKMSILAALDSKGPNRTKYE